MEIAPYITLSADSKYAIVFVDGEQAFKLKIKPTGGTVMGNVLTDKLSQAILSKLESIEQEAYKKGHVDGSSNIVGRPRGVTT